MPFPSWRKRLQTLLTSSDWLTGRSAKAIIGATIAVTTVPHGGATNTPLDPSINAETETPRVPKRIFQGFVLGRGPHKSVNPAKPSTFTPGTATAPTTPGTAARPVAPPRPPGGGHASHASHASHSSHRSHSSMWA